jgi:SPOR domain
VPDDLQIPPSAGGYGYRASYRAQSGGMDGMTRKLLIAAVGLGGVLLAGMGGWALLGHGSGPVPVIEADMRPLRVKPDNAGGMQVAGADEPAMGEQSRGAQGMAPRAEAPAPQALRAQQQLPPSPDVPAAAVSVPGPAVPPGPAIVANPGVSPLPDTPRPPARAGAAAAKPGAPAAAPGAGVTLVQLAAVDTEQGAQAEWQRLAKRMPDALGDRRLVLQRAERDGKAVWRVRTGGFSDVADATAFCSRLRAKGASCTIAAF